MKGLKTMIESTTVDSRLGVKRKTKKEKAAKDPNKPKRPATAFFIFMESFRVEFKENHPGTANHSFAAISKAGGEKWKMMSQAEKASYVAKAQQRKKEYEKKMQIYEREREQAGSNDEGSDKSKSEVYDAVGSKEDEDDA
ncbi:high mobility group B protein 3-like [Heracleum sosnowskyi]|uniref:High mobility group B protein 3-like n=1 Tax=Heracleum sosnowskyi TaxID=360622 RepID=A0AAD8IMQ4_9APIA|nr:high mobility group B protein 3-like [Heracleum sosnowskyi]